MKKLLIIALLTIGLASTKAITIINISQFPNTSNPGTNFLVVLANAGDTNYNMTMDQLSTWLANYSGFAAQVSANSNFVFKVASTNWPTETSSSNVIWTNTISYISVGGNFTSTATFNPSPVNTARLMISNSSSILLTNTLPFTAYSVSLGANISQAFVPAGSVLDLRFSYLNNTYFVEDYGKNNTALYGIATNNADSGFLVITNGIISIKH